MTQPIWIDLEVVLAIHDEQLAEHGGQAGVRDRGLLESAMGRPMKPVCLRRALARSARRELCVRHLAAITRSSTATSAPAWWSPSCSSR